MLEHIDPFDHPICLTQPLRLDNISAWVEHIPFGMFLLDILRPRILVELGTHTGVSYCAFCQAVKQLTLNTRCYAVDTWEGDAQAGFYGTEVLSDLRAHHDPLYGEFSSLVQSTFDEAIQYFSDGSIDLLHIDGCHSYEAVKHDFETWLPKLSDRGVVLFHDTNVHERNFGVWKLWAELQQQYPHFEFSHGHGLGILCIGNASHSILNGLTALPENQSRHIREFFFALGSRLSDKVTKEQIIETLTTQIAEKGQIIETLTAQITEKEQTLSASLFDKERELHEIYRSKAWRLIQFLRQVRLTLIPPGSTREQIARLLLDALRTWRKEGFTIILHKGYTRLSRKSPWNTRSNLSRNIDTYVPITEANVDRGNIDTRLIAFYLPQFHPIPENDAWWGKGFTEWTNVAKAVPNFAGHHQPHLPGELGFYDLRIPQIQERQVELAKKYGIYGFCFYYYWFAGKRLLELPLDQYLANPHLDLPFCLCWANENWTRRWDGAEHEVLIGQVHTESEYSHFIRDISPNFLDPRYIRVEGKPLLLVYRINLLPNPQKAAEIWRAECRKMGIGEIYLGAIQSFGIADPRPYGFDAAVEFPPSYLGNAEINRKSVKIINPEFQGKIFDYNVAAQIMIERKHEGYVAFKTVMPSWDNTARKQNDSHIFINSSPAAYKTWLEKVVAYSQKSLPKDKRFVFVNAWNEWAEGTYLEPDRRYGYAYLQATADAITKDRSTSSDWTILFVSHDANKGGAQEVLINVITWFKQHTGIGIKILCLQGGEWLPRFKKLAETIVLGDYNLHQNEDEMLELIHEFCEGAPDLIYGNTVVAGNAYKSLAKLNVPILTHIHELQTSIQKYGSEWIPDVLQFSSHFIACSKAVEENLIQNYKVQPENISLIHSSIISIQQDVLSNQHKKEVREKLGLQKDKVLIFGCGIGMPFRKGADLFIKLGEALLEKGCRNFHLYWIGNFDPEYEDAVYGKWGDHLTKLKHSEIKKHVTFLGFKENVREYLSCGDIFVLPSREDPFPLVALEAADCGLPILCFNAAGGMPDFVGEDAGFVVRYEDLEALVEKTNFLIENSPIANELGAHAKQKLINQFTIERTTPKILSTCRQVAGKKPAVSIIVPNYNHAAYLEQRLESIFNQTFKDFEIILLDDASTDQSMEIIENYSQHEDVKLVFNETNSGSPFRQWLKGIDMARSEILWVAESDDVCESTFLEALLPAFHDSRVKLAYANSHIIDESGSIKGDYLSTEYLTSLSKEKWHQNYKVTAEQEINDGLGIKNTILNMSAVLIRKFQMSTEFRRNLETMHIAGDWYFIVSAIRGGWVQYNASKLNYHRRHSGSVIAQTVSEKKIGEFFKEFYLTQEFIVATYPLNHDFCQKWQNYLQKQWDDFAKNRSFIEIERYYPFQKMKTKILTRISESEAKKIL